jgi:hypothetical protein
MVFTLQSMINICRHTTSPIGLITNEIEKNEQHMLRAAVCVCALFFTVYRNISIGVFSLPSSSSFDSRVVSHAVFFARTRSLDFLFVLNNVVSATNERNIDKYEMKDKLTNILSSSIEQAQ